MKRPLVALAMLASTARADDQPPQPAPATQEIVVVASRREEPRSATVAAIDAFEADDFGRRNATSVADVLREVPGVYVSPDGPSGQFTRVFLRGAASNQTLVLVDGVPMNDATTGGLFDFGDLGMTGVERVEVLRGSYSVLYGSEAVGGVVNVTTRRGRGPLSGYSRMEAGSFLTRGNEIGVSQGDADLDFAFAAGQRATNGQRDNEKFRERDAVGRFGAALGERLRIDGAARIAQSSVESPFDFASSGALPSDENIERRRRTFSGGTTLTWDATDEVTARAVLSALDVDSDFGNGPDGRELVDPDFTPGSGDEFGVVRNELRSSNRATDLRGRVEATATILRRGRDRPGLTVTGGGEHLRQRTISATTSPNFGAAGSSTTRLDDTTRTGSLFVQAELRAGEERSPGSYRWNAIRDAALVAGWRVDDHSVFGREGSPYVGARAEVHGVALRSSYGEGFRAPKPSELFDPFVGNADLGPETSQSFDAGASCDLLGGALTLGVTWFRLRVDGLIAFDQDVKTPSRPFGALTNFSRTQTTGFEYAAAADLGGGWRARGSLTAQNPRDLDTGRPLANRARTFGSAGVEWRCGAWRAGLDAFVAGGNPGQGGEFSSPDETARRDPGQRRLVDLTITWQADDDVTVFGGVRNLLNDAWVATPNSPAGPGIGVYAGVRLEF